MSKKTRKQIEAGLRVIGDVVRTLADAPDRRSGKERRQKDKMPHPSLRMSQRRIMQAVKERLELPAGGIVITSVSPPNAAVGDPTHQIIVELQNSAGAAVPGTITYGTTNAAVLTVSAGGVVTWQGAGSASVTLDAAGCVQKTVAFTVTSPISAVTHIDVTPAALALSVGAIGQLFATPRSVTDAAVLNQSLAYTEQSGAGDVGLANYTGAEQHRIDVQALAVGVRVVRVTHGISGSFTDRTVTITVPGGIVDSLSIPHELLTFPDALFHRCRLMGSSKGAYIDGANTGIGTGATRVGDYCKGYTESDDDNAEAVHIVTDITVPFQSERAFLYPTHGTRCGEFRCAPGQQGNFAFGRLQPFEITSTRYNTGGAGQISPCYNRKPRKMYERQLIKIGQDYPALQWSKWLSLFNPRNGNNCNLFAMNDGNSAGTLRNSFSSMTRNGQGSRDKELVDNRVLTNAIYTAGGASLGSSPTPIGSNLQWITERWYDCVRIERISTWAGPYTGPGFTRGAGQTGDGWTQFWRRQSDDGVNWTSWVLASEWTGQLNDMSISGTQQWWSNAIAYYMMHYTNNTAVTGRIRIAGSWLAFGEFE